ncbi:MAG: hypothetical protein ABIO60_07085 [Aquaticitalea sp.]
MRLPVGRQVSHTRIIESTKLRWNPDTFRDPIPEASGCQVVEDPPARQNDLSGWWH